MKQFLLNKTYLKRTSLILSALYGTIITLLALFNSLFQDIYQNNQWMELSFILFITYLIIYIKDAFIMDYIEIVIEKEEKTFLLHLLEHTLEPILIFFLFIGSTWILLLFNTDFVVFRLAFVLVTPVLYFQVKWFVVKLLQKK